MCEWIKTSDQLPPEGKYVLAKHNRGTWKDDDDQENVNCVVVKLVKGISKKEREALPEDRSRWRKESVFTVMGDRKHTVEFGDEHGNNWVPYAWERFGPDSFFGQAITHWMPIPKIK
jgi:hypothetical protein